jgi:hypothetical protein
MRLNASLIDLNYRSQRLPGSAFRIFTHFNGWLHLSRLRGLAPLACTRKRVIIEVGQSQGKMMICATGRLG